jgi:ABC-type antimicrobial peptide transport system permease subunit
MWKYRNQTLVSVAGLAVGFVCFAMSALWIRYEMTYDSFHKNTDRLYCVYRQSEFHNEVPEQRSTPLPLAGYLKSTFPEIANATFVRLRNIDLKYEEINYNADILQVDSSFLNMFDVRIVEGSMDFLIPATKKLAVTREKALQMFGNESPVGKKITIITKYSSVEFDICAVVTGLHKHSNYPFDFLGDPMFGSPGAWHASIGNTLVELLPGIDRETFDKKLYEHKVLHNTDIKNMTIMPLTSIRYKDANIAREVKFQHIIIFALAGSLLILCTLFNYLTLFVSRFRIRQRELALRTVYGASGRSLFAMLSVEFLISLIVAFILGLGLVNILYSSFMKVSGAKLELSAIYLESVIYIAGLVVVSLAVFFLTLAIFRRRTLDASIRSNKKILRRTSIVVQLTVSIVLAFCTLIILKQMYYLHSTSNLGFSFKNRGSIYTEMYTEEMAALNDKMKQIPEIKETLTEHIPLLPKTGSGMETINNWDDKQGGVEDIIRIEFAPISEQYVKFYELELIEGEVLKDDENKKYVLINESAAEAFGWYKSVGKSFEGREVKGVIKNIYDFAPTIAAKAVYYFGPNNDEIQYGRPFILFKYEGNWKTCISKITEIVEKEFPNRYFEYHNIEEEYNKYLKSENALLAILTVVSLVCVIICIFGFVSMVTLTCEERRKEIAIRKINGATIKDILDIFFKEYLTLLAVGALIAFPVGYIIMNRWRQNYVIQTEISGYVYLLILLALIMVIIMCIGGRVYKTSRENPVNALNK